MKITIDHLEKSYQETMVLKDISLEINSGDIIGILGVSGAGKSTLLRCINGLENYQSGSIQIDGQKMEKLSNRNFRKLKEKTGMIFQGNSLIEQKTIYKNVALPMECSGYNKKEIKDKVTGILKEVGLSDKAQVKPNQLSGGQKQRVAIARSLTMDPEILLCDEATSALDPSITNEILDLVNKLNQKYGLTIVVVTHQTEVVKRICNQLAVIVAGEIVEKGPVKDIFFNHSVNLQKIIGQDAQDRYSAIEGKVYLKLLTDLKQDNLFKTFFDEEITNFRLLSAETEQFRSEELSTLIFHFNQEDLEKIKKIATTVGFRYQLLGGH